jgi:hypothetical protein
MADVVELLRTTVGASDIKRVAIVDDVFDTPSIDPGDTGAFLEFLQSSEEVRAHAKIEQLVWAAAITDIGQGEHDSGNVAEVLEKLYEKYIDTGDVKCDPAGVFARERDLNLGFLRPLLELLRSCESLVIHTFGSATPTIGDEEMPDLVLVDLFLNPAISPVDEPNLGEALAAAEKSMARVRPLLTKNPAIILMSSHGEKGQQEADRYRAKLNNHVYASRFAFVDKGQVTKHPDRGVTVEGAARDTLLDVFQTYKFGKALSEAMTRWLEATRNAVEAMAKDVRSLQLKEIAYLIQFRLAAEGQGLEEYLEWFFGEALLDYIIRATDDAHAKKPLELALDPTSVAAIDGGFEPTKSVAEMYHRVRVESKRSRARNNFRLGDLYKDVKRNRVVAVMTPDCDLVLRQDKDKQVRNAEHLLFVPGQISDLEKASASVGDFLMIGDTPHNIQWSYKKVFSAPFSGTLEKAGQSGEDYEYLGALRPLYAQEIQANLLNHIGRVGVAVPPVIGIPAIATIVIRTSSTFKEISAQGTTFNCSLVPGRASTQNARVVFDREVIRRIRATLVNIPADDLMPGSAEKVEALKQENNGESVEKVLKLGPEIDPKIGKELCNGIMLATGKRDETATAPWCAIYVKPVKVKAIVPKQSKESGHQDAAASAIEEPLAPAMPAVGLVELEASVTEQGAGDTGQPAASHAAQQSEPRISITTE